MLHRPRVPSSARDGCPKSTSQGISMINKRERIKNGINLNLRLQVSSGVQGYWRDIHAGLLIH